MDSAILARVERFARAEGLFRRARLVVAAVSGGPDSVACLLVLHELRPRFGFELLVAHFDHQLRPASRADLEWVRELAARLEVPFLSGEGDVAAVARRQKASVEDTARRMRYQFLAFVAAEKRADAIATGHTRDDQAETVLMRILRGSGVRGIRGMLPATPAPGAPAQRLVRPLLPLSRVETEAICSAAGIEPLDDASNAELHFARNRLRHETLPALRALNPSLENALRGLAASARELFEGVERQSFAVQPRERGGAGAIFDLASFAALPAEGQVLLLEREAAFYHLQPEVNRTRIANLQSVLASGAGLVEFGNAVVDVSVGRVRVGPGLQAQPFPPRVLEVPGAVVAGPWRLQTSTSPLAAGDGAQVARIDTSSQKGALRIRGLAPGDRILYHRLVRKVADVLANAKVPAWERLGAVAVADGSRVHAVFTAAHTFEADHQPGVRTLLSVRLSPAAPAAPARREGPPGLALP